ncbi:hypothetical protein [Okeania sp. KiyG1]|uniref:hypothetical protein n=1 Tax=Okeania sp. KiyG1 TaxID=2720165 RepID=UPI0019241BA7|nr:hypothetical protein [Okeania sp. KiyG1]GGA13933.1 hypothetical protein CYANOKiyG1_27440 [Okeania sp. KiyG1]
MFCLLKTKDCLNLCTTCNYCFNYLQVAIDSQVKNYLSAKDEFNASYDCWKGERFAITSNGELIGIEKLYPDFHHVKVCIIKDKDRVNSILRKLVEFKQSPDEIESELRLELANIVIQLPWELVEGRELIPRDKDLQKFLRKANELAKKSNGIVSH